MSNTATPRVCLLVAWLVFPALSACQTAAPENAAPQPAPVAAEPEKTEVEPVAQANPEPALTSQKSAEPAQQASTGIAAQSSVNAAPAPRTSSAELVFLDFAGFDEDLSREMAAERAAIAVDVPAAFSLNEVPDRLDRWFYRVKESGGAVQAREKLREGEQQTRGIVGVLLDLAVSAIRAQEAEEMLRPAEDYNVVVEYDKQTGKADRVLFYRR